jgi:hypothetical protein
MSLQWTCAAVQHSLLLLPVQKVRPFSTGCSILTADMTILPKFSTASAQLCRESHFRRWNEENRGFEPKNVENSVERVQNC